MTTPIFGPKRFLIAAIVWAVVTIVVPGLPASSAEISVPRTCGTARNQLCSREINISGQIEAGDDQKVTRLLGAMDTAREEGPHFGPMVNLNSPGGDVGVAVTMGRILRAAQAMTFVNAGARCASACVLILAAGVFRSVVGDVIIHRPYFGSLAPGQSSTQVQQRYRAMRRQIDDYAQEMNLPSALIELMFSVPPERGRTLTYEEVDAFMLDGMDPVFDEQQTARFAQTWGMTSGEFRSRNARIEQSCRQPTSTDRARLNADTRDYNACRLAIMSNMPLQTARRMIEQGFPDWPGGVPVPWDWLARLNPSPPAPGNQSAVAAPQGPATSRPQASPPNTQSRSGGGATPDVLTLDELDRLLRLDALAAAVAADFLEGYIRGEIVHFGVCADVDQANRAAYLLAKTEYMRTPEIGGAIARTGDIRANEIVRAGQSPDIPTARRTAEARIGPILTARQRELRASANADPAAFAGQCRALLQAFMLRVGPFRPLAESHPNEMRLIANWR